MYLNQDAFVNNRNYPHGPAQFEIEQYDLTYNAVCTVVYIVGTWFTDGLLVCLKCVVVVWICNVFTL